MSDTQRTNEELALSLQSEYDPSTAAELWCNLERFVRAMAVRFLITRNGSTAPGTEVDDLVNEAYFSMLDAVKHYDPERGKFITLFSVTLATGYNIADAFDAMLKSAEGMINAPAEIVQEKYHTLRNDYQTMRRRLGIFYNDKVNEAHERLRYPRFN